MTIFRFYFQFNIDAHDKLIYLIDSDFTESQKALKLIKIVSFFIIWLCDVLLSGASSYQSYFCFSVLL